MIALDPDYFFNEEEELEEAIRELRFGKQLVEEGIKTSNEFLLNKGKEIINIGIQRGEKAINLLGAKVDFDSYLKKLREEFSTLKEH